MSSTFFILFEKEPNKVKDVLNIFNNGYNRQVILYGPPGTSKTHISTLIAYNFLAKNSDPDSIDTDIDKANEYLKDKNGDYIKYYKIVQFHPSYNYEDFVRGITIDINEDSKTPIYKTDNKIFGKISEYATADKEKNYVLIIDEINRAPIASVLGELIYGLEYRGQPISTPYEIKENSTLTIPENLYIIGTMNTADRSIGSIDYAVRRRFAFVPLLADEKIVTNSWKKKGLGNPEEKEESIASNVVKLFDEVQDLIIENLADISVQRDDIKIGHTYFLYDEKKCKGEKNAKKYMKYRIEYQILPILEEYIKDGLINDTGYNDKKTRWLELFGEKNS